MTKQDIQDWEDYNHGLQGTMTGSAYQEIKAAGPYSDNYSHANQVEEIEPSTPPSNSSSSNDGLGYIVSGVVGFLMLIMVMPYMSEDAYVPYIIASVTTMVAFQLCQVILIVVILGVALYFL